MPTEVSPESSPVLLGAAPIAKTFTEARQLAKVVGNQRQRPLPVSRDYLHIAVHTDFTAERFNAVENLVTQSVEITGVKLIWDSLDHDSPLRSYDQRVDLRNLTIYADQVIFRSEHHFHRTNVTIHARELVFEDEGAIHTTPRAQIAKPFTPRDAEGYPPNYQVADGKPGEPAGNVTLHVRDILIKGGDPRQKRIVCSGGNGQDGEDGGLKRYAPGGKRQPDAKNGKNLGTISLADLKTKLGDLHHVASNFHYPGYVDNVVSASVVAFIPVFPLPMFDQFFHPGPYRLDAVKFKSLGDPDYSFWWSDVHGLRPGNGEDAYPSGAPGRGGAGGAIAIEHQGQCPAGFDALCEIAGGTNGKSLAIRGGEPGSPRQAYHVVMRIPRSDADGTGLYHTTPHLWAEDVSNNTWGKDASAPVAAPSASGSKSIRSITAPTWLHPRLVDAVIAYARDAYRNGYREDAHAILDRYRDALASAATLDGELIAKRTAVLGLLANLANNLDYYGNNVGWVPRLNVTTSFKLFERERVNASRLLYFADTLATKWDALKHTADAASQATAAIEAELDFAQAAIVAANEEFATAKKSLTDLDAELQAAKLKFQSVFDRATAIAKQHVEAEQLVKGMCKLAGGLAKVVPVGQPYLGLAGGVVTELGDFEWTDADGKFTWDQVSSNFDGFGKEIGEKVDSFRKTHQDLLIKDQLAAGKNSLAQKVKDARGAIKNLDTDVDTINAEIERDWVKLRDGEIEAIKSRIKEIDGQIAGANSATKPALEKKKLSLADELKAAANERLQAARVRLENDLANKQAELEARDVTRKEALKKEVATLLEKKTAKQKGIDQLEKKEKLRETKAKETFDAMSGVGDGIAAIGSGLGAMFARVDADNPKLKALLAQLDTSALFDAALKKDYHDFRDTLDQINTRKGKAVASLLNVQQRILQYADSISSNLASLVALGRQRQSLDGVLGVEVRQYLHDLQQRARERLQAYLYEFIKAYQYQYLCDVGDSFYDFDRWVQKLRDLETTNADGTITPPTLQKIQEIEREVTRSDYLEMARKIVEERQHQAGLSANSYTCSLSEEQCATLTRRGWITFNVLQNFATHASLAMRDARILDLHLTTFDLDLVQGVQTPNLNLSFEHSGISVLLDGDGQYWFFQKGRTDDPIRWRYIWKSPDRLDKDVKIEADEFLDGLLPQSQIKYREYMPGLLSDVTFWINRDSPPDERMREVAKIKAVSFELSFVYR